MAPTFQTEECGRAKTACQDGAERRNQTSSLASPAMQMVPTRHVSRDEPCLWDSRI